MSCPKMWVIPVQKLQIIQLPGTSKRSYITVKSYLNYFDLTYIIKTWDISF